MATALIERRKPTKLIAMALANKMARIARALMISGRASNQHDVSLDLTHSGHTIGEDYDVMRFNTGPMTWTLR